jgi:hypothetical protein
MPLVISDWPWSERAYPPNSGSIYGTVKNGDGKGVVGAWVYPSRDDVPAMKAVRWGETDAEGHFEIHSLQFGHYWVGTCMGPWCRPRDWPVQIALGPASRVTTVELRLPR